VVAKRLTFAEQLLQRLDAKIDALTQLREELLAEIEAIKAAKKPQSTTTDKAAG
jgi:prefoldin subunit 5